MPPQLRKAHQANDRAVMAAYGFDAKTMTEANCVAELMKMYQKLTAQDSPCRRCGRKIAGYHSIGNNKNASPLDLRTGILAFQI